MDFWKNKSLGSNTSTAKVFFVQFDILGFKNFIQGKGTARTFRTGVVKDIFMTIALATQLKKIEEICGKEINYVNDIPINIGQYADTIVLSTHDSNPSDFVLLTNLAYSFLYTSIKAAKLPLRGGFGKGDLIWRQGTSQPIGSALIDAYEAESQLAAAGCLFSNSFSNQEITDYIINFHRRGVNDVISAEMINLICTIKDAPIQKSTSNGKVFFGEQRNLINWKWQNETDELIKHCFEENLTGHPKRLKENSIQIEKMLASKKMKFEMK